MSSLPPAHWQSRIKEMGCYYSYCLDKGQLKTFVVRYYPDDSVSFQSGAAGSPPKEVAEKIEGLGQEVVEEHKGIADNMKAEGDELKAKKLAREDLKKKIDEMKERMKKNSADSIDRNGEKLYEMLEDKDPAVIQASLSGWETVIGILARVWDNILKALFEAWKAVVNFFENAWKAVENAFNSAKDWLVGAANSIKNLFGF